jgi:Phage-related minor tail protein
MSELNASVVVDLTGNLQRQASRYTQSLQQFSQRGSRHISVLRRSMAGLNRGLNRLGNRYTALLTGGSVVAVGKSVADLDARINQLGIDAGKNGDELVKFKTKIKGEIQQAAIAARISSDEIIGALESIVEKSGDVEFASRNLNNLTTAIAATGSSGSDIGKLAAELQDIGFSEKQVLGTLDALVQLGQQGSFTLKDMAALSGSIFSAYGPTNQKQVLEMGAAVQIFRDSNKSSDEAATSFKAFMRTLKDGTKLKKLYGAGIDVVDKEALERGEVKLNSIDTILRSIAEVTKGDDIKLSGLIDDSEARVGLSKFLREYRETGKTARLDKLMGVTGTGAALMQDAADNAKTFNSSLTTLSESGKRFADLNLSGPIQNLADTLNELKPEEIERYFEAAKRGVLLLGGAIVASKVIGFASNLKYLRGGKGGGRGAGALAAAGGAPMPVYVVNLPGQPGGFVPGGNAGSPTAPGKNLAKRGSKFSRLIRGSGRAIPGMALAGGAYQVYDIATSDKPVLDKVDDGLAVAGGLAGSLAGGQLGAMIGTAILPGIGTAIGGLLGGLGGYLAGEFGGDKFGDWITAKDKAAVDANNRADAPQGGTGKVVVEVLGLGRVRHVEADGMDLEALGPTMVGD